MNKDKLDDKEKKFWLGESSLEDEQLLKSDSENPYFEALKSDAEEKMDWNFQDFLDTVAEKEVPAKIVKDNFHFNKIWWMAAALLVLIGMIWIGFSNKNEQNTIVSNKQIDKSNNIRPTDSTKTSEKTIASNNTNPPKIITASPKKAIKSLEKRHRNVAPPTSNKNAVPEADSLDGYEPQFVVINGKPVYDEVEAIKITKQSLALLSDNVSKSASRLSVVKELSIHF